MSLSTAGTDDPGCANVEGREVEMAPDSRLRPIDGGTQFMIRGTARPETNEPEAVARAIGEVLAELAGECPDRHFIRRIEAKGDGLRDGVPRGSRFSVSMVFAKYPDHYKRGVKPQETDNGSQNE